MARTYRLLLLEDDPQLAGSLTRSLGKQSLFTEQVDIQTLSYAEFDARQGMARNSSRELIVLGGKASLDYHPDNRLLKSLVAQLERTHVFLLTPAQDAREILSMWLPGVYGVLERNERVFLGLMKAIRRIQQVQKPRSSSRRSKSSSPSFWKQLRTALGSLFT
jgi:hypothetical protein